MLRGRVGWVLGQSCWKVFGAPEGPWGVEGGGFGGPWANIGRYIWELGAFWLSLGVLGCPLGALENIVCGLGHLGRPKGALAPPRRGIARTTPESHWVGSRWGPPLGLTQGRDQVK